MFLAILSVSGLSAQEEYETPLFSHPPWDSSLADTMLFEAEYDSFVSDSNDRRVTYRGEPRFDGNGAVVSMGYYSYLFENDRLQKVAYIYVFRTEEAMLGFMDTIYNAYSRVHGEYEYSVDNNQGTMTLYWHNRDVSLLISKRKDVMHYAKLIFRHPGLTDYRESRLDPDANAWSWCEESLMALIEKENEPETDPWEILDYFDEDGAYILPED